MGYLPHNLAAHHLQIMQALLVRRRHRRSNPQATIHLGTPKADNRPGPILGRAPYR